MKEFKTTHNLSFEVAPYEIQLDPNIEWKRFRVGTCEGLWTSTKTTYDILAINNTEIGNGHLQDVFEWFEHSCKRDKRDLRILEVFNLDFMIHCIKKRGFKKYNEVDLIKKFNLM